MPTTPAPGAYAGSDVARRIRDRVGARRRHDHAGDAGGRLEHPAVVVDVLLDRRVAREGVDALGLHAGDDARAGDRPRAAVAGQRDGPAQVVDVLVARGGDDRRALAAAVVDGVLPEEVVLDVVLREVGIRGIVVAAERHVDDVRVVVAGAEHRVGDPAREPAVAGGERLVAHHLRVGRDAVGADAVVVADHAARHPRPVAVGVGLRAVVQRADAAAEDGGEPVARDRVVDEQHVVAQLRVRRVDARVDHGDLDPGALGGVPRLADAVAVVLPLQDAGRVLAVEGVEVVQRVGLEGVGVVDAVQPGGLDALLALDLAGEAGAGRDARRARRSPRGRSRPRRRRSRRPRASRRARCPSRSGRPGSRGCCRAGRTPPLPRTGAPRRRPPGARR